MKQDVSSGSQSSDADPSSSPPENLSAAPQQPTPAESAPEASTARALQPVTPEQPPKPSLKLRPQPADAPEPAAPAPLGQEPAPALEPLTPQAPEPQLPAAPAPEAVSQPQAPVEPQLPAGLPPLEPLSSTNPGLESPAEPAPSQPQAQDPAPSVPPAPLQGQPPVETPSPAEAPQVAAPPTGGTAPRFEIRKGPPRESVAKGVTLPPISQSRPQVPGQGVQPGESAPPQPVFSGLPDNPPPQLPEDIRQPDFNPAVSTDLAAQALEGTLNPEPAPAAPRPGLRVRKEAAEPPPFVEEAAEPVGAGKKEKSGVKGGLFFLLVLLLIIGGGTAAFFYGIDKVLDGDFLSAGSDGGDAGERGPETRDFDGEEITDPFAAVESPVLATQQQVLNNQAAHERNAEVNRILQSGGKQPRILSSNPNATLPEAVNTPQATPTPTPAAPPPAPIKKLKPQPEVVHYLRSLHITGVFMNGSGSAKMMVDGQVFLLGQTINPDLQLRWVDYRKEDGRLIFQDAQGMGYVKKF